MSGTATISVPRISIDADEFSSISTIFPQEVGLFATSFFTAEIADSTFVPSRNATSTIMS